MSLPQHKREHQYLGYDAVSIDSNQVVKIDHKLEHGELLELRAKTVEVSGLSGASVSVADWIPPGAIVVGFATRVLETITGPTSIDIGIDADVDLFANNATGLSVGSTTDNKDWNSLNLRLIASGSDLKFTGVGGSFTGGKIRATIHFFLAVAPTS